MNALCTPNEMLKKLQDESRFTELMVMQEEIKTYPFGAVWEEYCRQCGVAGDTGWLEEIKEYEAKVLSLRK